MFNSNDKIQEFKNILNKQNEMFSANSIGTTYTVTPTEIEITPVTNKYKIIIVTLLVILCLFLGINIANSTISDTKPKVVVDYSEDMEDEVAIVDICENIKKNICDSITNIYTTIKVDVEDVSLYILSGRVNIEKQYISA